jgi:hypothetical protein
MHTATTLTVVSPRSIGSVLIGPPAQMDATIDNEGLVDDASVWTKATAADEFMAELK